MSCTAVNNSIFRLKNSTRESDKDFYTSLHSKYKVPKVTLIPKYKLAVTKRSYLLFRNFLVRTGYLHYITSAKSPIIFQVLKAVSMNKAGTSNRLHGATTETTVNYLKKFLSGELKKETSWNT
jgi:hypothetical protein